MMIKTVGISSFLPIGPGMAFNRESMVAGTGDASALTGLSLDGPADAFATVPSGGGIGNHPTLNDRLESIFSGVEDGRRGLIQRQISSEEILYVLKMIADQKFHRNPASVVLPEAKSESYSLPNRVIVTGSEIITVAYAVLTGRTLPHYATMKDRNELYLHTVGHAEIDRFVQKAIVKNYNDLIPPAVEKGFFLADMSRDEFIRLATYIVTNHLRGNKTLFLEPRRIHGKLFTYTSEGITKMITGSQLLGLAATFALSRTVEEPSELDANLKEYGENNTCVYLFKLIGPPGSAMLPTPPRREVRHGVKGRPRKDQTTTIRPPTAPATREELNPYKLFANEMSVFPAFSKIPPTIIAEAIVDSFAKAGDGKDNTISTTIPHLVEHLRRNFKIERALLVAVLKAIEPFISIELAGNIIDEVYIIRNSLLQSADWDTRKNIDKIGKEEAPDSWLSHPIGLLLGMDRAEGYGFTRLIANICINGLILQLFSHYLPEDATLEIAAKDVIANAGE